LAVGRLKFEGNAQINRFWIAFARCGLFSSRAIGWIARDV